MDDTKKRVMQKIAEENAVPEVLKRARRLLDGKSGERMLYTFPNISDWLAEFATAELNREWIPVSERLPEATGDYLVTENRETGIRWFHAIRGEWIDSEGDEVSGITHWQSLLAPAEATTA